jgi:hypothetical protein
MLYGTKVAAYFEINTKHTHRVWAEYKILECKTCCYITQAVDFQMLIIKCFTNALKKGISAVSKFVIFLHWLKFRSSILHICSGISLILCLLK